DFVTPSNSRSLHWMSASSVLQEGLVARLSDADNNQRTLIHKNLLLNTHKFLLEEGKNNVSYIFPPRGNNFGQSLVKLRKGAQGELGENQPDVIVRLSELGVEEILKDRDSDATSPYTRFYNTGAINDLGHVVVMAAKDSQAVILLVKGKE